jgi:hypothetical protein
MQKHSIHTALRNVAATLKRKEVFSLRQLALAIGVHREKLRLAVKRDPELARLTEHITGWNGARGGKTIESRIVVIEEAKCAGKIRAVRDALVISNIHWATHKKYLAKHEEWRRVMADVLFNDPTPLRTVNHTGHRAHVLYSKYVRQNERKGIAQPEASWGAVDKAMDEVAKHQKKKNAKLRKLKWGDAAIDVQKKKKKYFTKKDAERVAKQTLGHLHAYNFLRAIAVRSGRTVDEVADDAPNAALRKRYRAAIAECRDKKSLKESAARGELRKAEKAEREVKAAGLRKRPDLVPTRLGAAT